MVLREIWTAERFVDAWPKFYGQAAEAAVIAWRLPHVDTELKNSPEWKRFEAIRLEAIRARRATSARRHPHSPAPAPIIERPVPEPTTPAEATPAAYPVEAAGAADAVTKRAAGSEPQGAVVEAVERADEAQAPSATAAQPNPDPALPASALEAAAPSLRKAKPRKKQAAVIVDVAWLNDKLKVLNARRKKQHQLELELSAKVLVRWGPLGAPQKKTWHKLLTGEPVRKDVLDHLVWSFEHFGLDVEAPVNDAGRGVK